MTLESNNHTGVNIYKLLTHEGQNFDLKFSTKLGDDAEAESFIYDNDDILNANIDISNGNYCFYSDSAPAREELWTYRKFSESSQSVVHGINYILNNFKKPIFIFFTKKNFLL